MIHPIVHQQHHKHHLVHPFLMYVQVFNACLGTFFFGYSLGNFNVCQKYIIYKNGWLTPNQQSLYLGMVTGASPLGGFIGAFLAQYVIQGLMKGHVRYSLILFDIIGILGCIIIGSDYTLGPLVAGRFITGLAIGMNTACVPLYVRDVSPLQISSVTSAFTQILLALGTFTAYMMGWIVPLSKEWKGKHDFNNENYRIVLGFPLITCCFRMLMLLFFFRYDIPQYLVMNQKYGELKRYLHDIYKEDEIHEVIEELEDKYHVPHQDVELQQQKDVVNSQQPANSERTENNLHSLSSSQSHVITKEEKIAIRKLNMIEELTKTRRYTLSVMLSVATQITGVNALLFYSSKIYMTITGDEQQAAYYTRGLGGSMVFFCIFGTIIVSKIPRRTVTFFGLIVVVIILVLLAIFAEMDIAAGGLVCSMLFMFGYQTGCGACYWAYMSEISDKKALSLSTAARWFCTFIIGVIFPFMVTGMGLFGSFLFFACLTTFVIILFCFIAKETIGLDKNEIYELFLTEKEKELVAKHNFDDDLEREEKVQLQQKQ